MNPYQPISCELHSQYELYALHKTQCAIQYKDAKNHIIKTEGIIDDIYVRNHAEYCRLINTHQHKIEIRLDRITSCFPIMA